VTYAALTRKLRGLGCLLKRRTRGSHEIWHNPRSNRSAAVPNHSGDIPVGTLRAILRQLDIAPEDLDSA